MQSLAAVIARFEQALQDLADDPSAVNVARYLHASRELDEAREADDSHELPARAA